jgi:two-component system, cell cycle response regulator DivK
VTKVLYIEDNDDNVYMHQDAARAARPDFEVLDGGGRPERVRDGSYRAAGHHPDGSRNARHRWLGSHAATEGPNPQTRDIPVVVLSAHALAGKREKAIAAGCAAIIIPWGGGLGVSYTYINGDAEAAPIRPADWPVIRMLERDGKLSFASQKIHERFLKLRARVGLRVVGSG